MTGGRPRQVDPETLFAFAHQFYWDFRRLDEGAYRWRFNEKEYKRLIGELERENVQLSDEQKSSINQCIEEEIQAGRLKEEEREVRWRELEAVSLSATSEWRHMLAGDKAMVRLKVPGERQVLQALLQAESPRQVREICKDAFVSRTIEVAPGQRKDVTVPNWPISAGSVLPFHLSRHAAEFIAGTKDPRFPRSGRKSSKLKQLWFLSRALAGALFGVKTRTAINLVGSKRPDQIFEESRAGKPVRRKRRKK